MSRDVWFLEAFEKPPGEHLVEQWEVPIITDDIVSRIWNWPPENPVLGGFEVTEAVVDELRKFVQIPIDLERFIYFVELLRIS